MFNCNEVNNSTKTKKTHFPKDEHRDEWDTENNPEMDPTKTCSTVCLFVCLLSRIKKKSVKNWF